MEVMDNKYLPVDKDVVNQIVGQLKAQGIFDQLRKECISDVDTKPAYQNLRQRVEGNVNRFLHDQHWQPDMNKNQVRELLRKTITESGYLETGVERIVEQVVNPKIATVFLPKVQEVVYQFFGVSKEQQMPPDDDEESPPFEPLDADSSMDGMLNNSDSRLTMSDDNNSNSNKLPEAKDEAAEFQIGSTKNDLTKETSKQPSSSSSSKHHSERHHSRDKDKHNSRRHSSSTTKDKDKDRSKEKSSRDKNRHKSSKHRNDKDSKSSSNNKRDDDDRHKKKKSSYDDHYSAKDKGRNDRRSTDRDSNDETSFNGVKGRLTVSVNHATNGAVENNDADVEKSGGSHSGKHSGGGRSHSTKNQHHHHKSTTQPLDEKTKWERIRKQLAKLEENNEVQFSEVPIDTSTLISASIRLEEIKELTLNSDANAKEENILPPLNGNLVKDDSQVIVNTPLVTVSQSNWELIESKMHDEMLDCRYLEPVDASQNKFLQFMIPYLNGLQHEVDELLAKKKKNGAIAQVDTIRKEKPSKLKVSNKPPVTNKKKIKRLVNKKQNMGAHLIRIKLKNISTKEKEKKINKMTKRKGSNEIKNKNGVSQVSLVQSRPASTEAMDIEPLAHITTPTGDIVHKGGRRSALSSQRYSSDDLYKPRSSFASSRRSRCAQT